MKGVDTNVLVRYLTRDDAEQFELARRFIEGSEAAGERLRLSAIVLCELVWVLAGRRYRFDREMIASTIENVLEVGLFDVEHREPVTVALEDFRRGKGDFADYVIGHVNRASGYSETATFDGDLNGEENFVLLN